MATIDDQIEGGNGEADGQITINDVSKVVAEVMGNIDGAVSFDNLQLKGELKSLLSYIDQAKNEIVSLRPKEYSVNRIPEASDELCSIVKGTESAAERVMDCADEINDLAEKCDNEVKVKLVDVSTNLFEASSFQDITGQRVSKVAATLDHLEKRLNALANAIGDTDVDEDSIENADTDKDYDAMANEDFLNGPQLEDEANDQAAIDALFDDF